MDDVRKSVDDKQRVEPRADHVVVASSAEEEYNDAYVQNGEGNIEAEKNYRANANHAAENTRLTDATRISPRFSLMLTGGMQTQKKASRLTEPYMTPNDF